MHAADYDSTRHELHCRLLRRGWDRRCLPTWKSINRFYGYYTISAIHTKDVAALIDGWQCAAALYAAWRVGLKMWRPTSGPPCPRLFVAELEGEEIAGNLGDVGVGNDRLLSGTNFRRQCIQPLIGVYVHEDQGLETIAFQPAAYWSDLWDDYLSFGLEELSDREPFLTQASRSPHD